MGRFKRDTVAGLEKLERDFSRLHEKVYQELRDDVRRRGANRDLQASVEKSIKLLTNANQEQARAVSDERTQRLCGEHGHEYIITHPNPFAEGAEKFCFLKCLKCGQPVARAYKDLNAAQKAYIKTL